MLSHLSKYFSVSYHLNECLSFPGQLITFFALHGTNCERMHLFVRVLLMIDDPRELVACDECKTIHRRFQSFYVMIAWYS